MSAASAPAAASCALIVLTRAPLAGRTKTRMMPALSPDQCADLHRALLADEGHVCRQAAAALGARLQVLVDPFGEVDAARCAFGPADEYGPQAEGGLGARMAAAMAAAFSAGSRRCVLVGSDCPELSAHDVSQAFSLLGRYECVLGPTFDGGYYLVGMCASHPELFDIEGYGGPTVLARTLSRVQDAGLHCALLPERADMDEVSDLRALAQRMRRAAGASPCPATERFLCHLQEQGVLTPVRR